MKITYTGRQIELSPAQRKRIDALFARLNGKLSKMLDRKSEREAHVVIGQQRHLHNVEVTVPNRDHPLVGVGADADLITAIKAAIDRLEQQTIKVRAKWRDTKRQPRKHEEAAAEMAATATEPEPEAASRIYKVSAPQRRKPMTLDEAVMEMEGRDYLVYRDSETSKMQVLVRRKDGNLDLVES